MRHYPLLADGTICKKEKERIRDGLPSILRQTRIKAGNALLRINLAGSIHHTGISFVGILVFIGFLARVAVFLLLGLGL